MAEYITLVRKSGNIYGKNLTTGETWSGQIGELEYFTEGTDCHIRQGNFPLRTRNFAEIFVSGTICASAQDFLDRMATLATSATYDTTAGALSEDGRVHVIQWVNGRNAKPPLAGEDVSNVGNISVADSLDGSAVTYYARSSGADTRYVTGKFLDATFDAATVTVQLNGTTAVAFSGTYLRVNDAYTNSAAVAEEITIAKVSGVPPASSTRAKIPSGFARMQTAAWTCPTGMQAIIRDVWIGVQRIAGTFESVRAELVIKRTNCDWETAIPLVWEEGGQTFQLNLGNTPIHIDPGHTAKIRITSINAANTAAIEAGFSVWQYDY